MVSPGRGATEAGTCLLGNTPPVYSQNRTKMFLFFFIISIERARDVSREGGFWSLLRTTVSDNLVRMCRLLDAPGWSLL